MGCYDTIVFKCPRCGCDVELQTKAGACNMERIWSREVPTKIAVHAQGELVTCEGYWLSDAKEKTEGCGATFAVDADVPILPSIAMRLVDPSPRTGSDE